MVPAVGQGALAVETRAAEEAFANLLRATVNDPASELCVTCERAALRAMRAGCSAPIGVHAYLAGKTMIVEGAYAPARGALLRKRIERGVSTLHEAETLGIQLAAELESFPAAVSGVER
jgi:porphobilinogen deaminase